MTGQTSKSAHNAKREELLGYHKMGVLSLRGDSTHCRNGLTTNPWSSAKANAKSCASDGGSAQSRMGWGLTRHRAYFQRWLWALWWTPSWGLATKTLFSIWVWIRKTITSRSSKAFLPLCSVLHPVLGFPVQRKTYAVKDNKNESWKRWDC